MITRQQCRAARKLLGWKGIKLGKRANVNPVNIHTFEIGGTPPHPETIEKIVVTLEAAGIEFITGDSEGAGVRLRLQEGAHDH